MYIHMRVISVVCICIFTYICFYIFLCIVIILLLIEPSFYKYQSSGAITYTHAL